MPKIKWSQFPDGGNIQTNDTLVGLRAGANVRLNAFTPASTLATTGGTTTLLATSNREQIFTGTLTQTVLLPVTSTLTLGQSYLIINNSSNNITVNASDSSLVFVLTPNTQATITCVSTSNTSNVGWNCNAAMQQLSPTQENVGFAITGSSADAQFFNFYYSSAYILGTYYNNLKTSTYGSATLDGPTTYDLGSVELITNGLSIYSSVITSFIANSLLAVTFISLINTPLLATFSMNSLIAIYGAITLTSAPVLTTLSFPALQNMTNFTITSAPSLTTISMPSLINMLGPISGTANALTSLTLTNLKLIYGNYALTANALTTLSMPALVNIGYTPSIATGGNFAPVGTSLATVNMPSLVTVNGTFIPTLAALTSLTVTSLTTVTGAFAPTFAALTTLSLPALTTLGAGFAPVCASATTVTLTSLANITGSVAASFASLTTLSLPALVSVSTTFTITAANLVTFSIGNTLKNIGGNFTMTGMKLDQASVDGILVSLAALDGTNGTTAYSNKTVNLSGGTSSAPSATGLAAKATLVGRGCTVNTN